MPVRKDFSLFIYLLLVCCCLLLSVNQSKAQFNVHELGKKKIYFGVALGMNFSDFKIVRKPFSPDLDTITSIRPRVGPGFNLGIIANWQFHRYFDLRFIPQLIFSDKTIEYTQRKISPSVVRKTVTNIYLDFPLLLRFKSDPIKDFRIYVIAGMRYDFDLASNQKARKANDIIKLARHDLSAEYGVGVMIYFPYFIMSPEFKMSHGVLNINAPSEGLIYSRPIDKLFSRTFTFTLNLEG